MPTDTITTCAYCGSANLFSVILEPPSPHYARLGCRDCQRSLGFEPAPMTAERAAAFVLPFGKYSGMAVGKVAASAEGRRYLRWLADQDGIRATIRRAIEFHLGTLGPDAGGP